VGPSASVESIYDTSNEVHNPLKCLNYDDGPHGSLEPSVVAALMKMCDENNPFAKKLRTAGERLRDYPEEEFIIRIVGAIEVTLYSTIYQQLMILPYWLLEFFL
jgi:hypothetical protein